MTKIKKYVTLLMLAIICALSAVSFGAAALAYSDQDIDDGTIRDNLGKITIGTLPTNISTPNTLEYVCLFPGIEIPIEEGVWYKCDYYVDNGEVKMSEFLTITDNSEDFGIEDLAFDTQISDYFIYFKFATVENLDYSEFGLLYSDNVYFDYAFIAVESGCETASVYGMTFRETFDERISNSLNLSGGNKLNSVGSESEEHPESLEYVYFENWDVSHYQEPRSYFYKVELNTWYRSNVMNVSEDRRVIYNYAYNSSRVRGASDITSFIILENIYRASLNTYAHVALRTLDASMIVEKTVGDYVYFKILESDIIDDDVVTIHYDYRNNFLYSPMLRFAIASDSSSAELYDLGDYEGYSEDPSEQHYVKIGYRDNVQLNTWYRVRRGYDDYNLLPSALKLVYQLATNGDASAGVGEFVSLYNIFAPTSTAGYNEKIFDYELKTNSYLNGVVVDIGNNYVYFKITEKNMPTASNNWNGLLRMMTDEQVIDRTQGAIYRSNGLLSDFPDEPEEPDDPEDPEDPDNPDNPETPDNPEDPADESGESNQADQIFDNTHSWVNSTFGLNLSASTFGAILIGIIIVLAWRKR